jgi:hypothetical protein
MALMGFIKTSLDPWGDALTIDRQLLLGGHQRLLKKATGAYHNKE